MECCFTFYVLSFERKSLSFENALSYIQAFRRTHMHFSEREAVCSNTSIHWAKWMECCFTFKMLSFQRKSLSFESALSYLHTFTGNSNAFLWKRSCLFQHFNSLCEVNGVLLHFLNAVLSEKITFLWKCLKLLTHIHRKLKSVSMKEKLSVPTFQFTVGSEWSVASLSKCCLSEKITFLWKCLMLLTSIQQKLTCISLKVKQSFPTLQFTVRSEWSVASLSKCCPVTENHFPLKVP